MIEIVRISPVTCGVFKDVRLRALQESPIAFGSTYAKESQFPAEEWERRAARASGDDAAGFLAFDAGYACGIVFCFKLPEDAQRADIVSMWVDPGFRRSGVGRALIDAASQWAKKQGVQELKLMVTSVNHRAIAFYERLGFAMTGKTEPYPNDPKIVEYEMARPVV